MTSRRIDGGVVSPSATNHSSEKTSANDLKQPTIVVVSGDKKRQRAVERSKRDIRARCVTCLCLILTCAIALGVVSIVLMSEVNSGLFTEEAINDAKDRTVGLFTTPLYSDGIHHDHRAPDNARPGVDSNQPATPPPGPPSDDGDSSPFDESSQRTTRTPEVTTQGLPRTPDGHHAVQTPPTAPSTRNISSKFVPGLLLTTRKMPLTRSPNISCVPVSEARSICKKLPYNYTTEEAKEFSISGIDNFFFDPGQIACHAQWIFFLCAYILPECETLPPSSGWKPRCLCQDFNETIFRECSSAIGGRTGVPSRRLTCEGRAKPTAPDCLKP